MLIIGTQQEPIQHGRPSSRGELRPLPSMHDEDEDADAVG